MLNNDLIWLLRWYVDSGQNQMRIGKISFLTIRNPGWSLEVTLDEGELQNKPFTKVFIERTEDDWIYCNKENGLFSGCGGPLNLPEIIGIFLKWVRDVGPQKTYENLPIRDGPSFSDHFCWLLEWFYSQCDEYWEECYSIRMETIKESTWRIKIMFSETELEDKVFDEIKIKHSEDDWLHCYTENKIFHGFGGIFNLPEMLSIFCNWAQEAEPPSR